MSAKPNPLNVIWADVLVTTEALALTNLPPLDWVALASVATGNLAHAARRLEYDPPDNYRRSLLRLAAVAVLAVECFDDALKGKAP